MLYSMRNLLGGYKLLHYLCTVIRCQFVIKLNLIIKGNISYSNNNSLDITNIAISYYRKKI